MTGRFEEAPASAPAAVGTQAWEVTVDRQRSAVADHVEFYALAAEAVSTLHALENLTRVLSRQVDGYGHGRRLRDDSGSVDPAVRLAQAVADLDAMESRLRHAAQAANQFWSGIGHIAVDEEDRS